MIKFCPVCKQQFTERDYFCSTCTAANGGPVALHAALSSTANQPGIAIGAKAVVSGEVIARKDQHIYEGTANVTHILQVDETKQVHTCSICGVKGTVARGFHGCPGCGKTACADHFDMAARQCVDCRDAAVAVREDIYRRHAYRFLSAGNLIDPWQRNQLDLARGSLGLSAVRTADIEQAVKRSLPGKAWGEEEQRQLDAARALLVSDQDPRQALSYLEPLVQRHPDHQDLQQVWLEALAEADPERALAMTDTVQADVPAVHLVRARLLAERGRYQEGLDLLADAAVKPHLRTATVRFFAMAAEIAIKRYAESGNPLYLADAAAHLRTVAGSRDPHVLVLTAWLGHIKGEATALRRLLADHAQDLDVRRINRVLGPLPEPGSPEPGRIFRSRAHHHGIVWEPAPELGGYVRITDEAALAPSRDGRREPVAAPSEVQKPAEPTPVKSDSKVFHRLAPTEVISDTR